MKVNAITPGVKKAYRFKLRNNTNGQVRVVLQKEILYTIALRKIRERYPPDEWKLISCALPDGTVRSY